VFNKTKRPCDDLKPLLKKDKMGKWCFDGPTIIYCPTRKATEAMADTIESGKVPHLSVVAFHSLNLTEFLSELHIKCVMYHAGLTPKQRTDGHHKFSTDTVPVR